MNVRLNTTTLVHGASLTLRVVVGSYILASAVALAIDPAQLRPFGGLVGSTSGIAAAATFLFVAGLLLMLGQLVRPVAMMLCAYLFCDAWVHLVSLSPGAFWNDISLLVTVLLVSSNARRLAASSGSGLPSPA